MVTLDTYMPTLTLHKKACLKYNTGFNILLDAQLPISTSRIYKSKIHILQLVKNAKYISKEERDRKKG